MDEWIGVRIRGIDGKVEEWMHEWMHACTNEWMHGYGLGYPSEIPPVASILL